MHRLILCLLLLVTYVAHVRSASAAQLTAAENRYVEYVFDGKISEARSIRELANINPNDIGGKSLASQTFGWRPVGIAGMRIETLHYLFKELKLDPNAPYEDERRSVFSTMCESVFNPRVSKNYRNIQEQLKVEFTQKYQIFKEAKASGRPFPGIKPNERDDQPLPTCIKRYTSSKKDEEIKEVVRESLLYLLDNGADPNYAFSFINVSGIYYPIYAAFENYDSELFKLLVEKGANINSEFKKSANCPVTNGLAFLPDPKEEDIEAASFFLALYIYRMAEI